MIDVNEHNEIDLYNIKIQPCDNIFKELGNNTYTFIDLISEFIDNAIGASIEHKKLEVAIEIGISKEKESSYIIIKDNAKGISREDLGLALSPGGTSGGSTLNEHGFGFKQAIASLGTLKYMATKTSKDKEALVVTELKYGEIPSKLIKVTWSHGTEICVSNLKAIVPINTKSYTRVNLYLGARYRRFLKPANKKMNLEIKFINLDTEKIYEWNINEVNPIYFHPNKRTNEAIIHKQKFITNEWEANFTFGYAPKEREYDYMGLERPKRFFPYHVSMNKQGFDIFRNDRIVKFHQLCDLGIVGVNHSKYNYIRGEINLINGFSTAITKNHIINDSNFNELIECIKTFLTEKKYLEFKTYPDVIPESLLRDRLRNHFLSRTINPKKNVLTEYPVNDLEASIDIFADDEAWELKSERANGTNVYQLFGYMDVGNIDVGYLVAPIFSKGAEFATKHINEKYNKHITLVNTSEFPIQHEPSESELKKYY
ncbi:ATP-binding protein [Clostridium estertheticum]|uniref:ATP-binding protein n=1 Tax=Clostridium estertheticum TaxID=238834 RepID=UPI001CF36359|nr:ATP-binding protein [Clostridium estertheticum]MCB2354364.1 ATP-binding protein [Clostridium estertheticum]WAG42517.1 ATP-binding protein [Clostridium estertheticum]